MIGIHYSKWVVDTFRSLKNLLLLYKKKYCVTLTISLENGKMLFDSMKNSIFVRNLKNVISVKNIYQ